jgi:hypothetical protein
VTLKSHMRKRSVLFRGCMGVAAMLLGVASSVSCGRAPDGDTLLLKQADELQSETVPPDAEAYTRISPNRDPTRGFLALHSRSGTLYRGSSFIKDPLDAWQELLSRASPTPTRAACGRPGSRGPAPFGSAGFSLPGRPACRNNPAPTRSLNANRAIGCRARPACGQAPL